MIVKYINNFNLVDIDSKKRNVTIGFFDGIHLGHQHVINSLIEGSNGICKTVITFDYHPIKRLIMPLNEKISVLNKFDIDEVIVIQMNDEIKETCQDDFIGFLKCIDVNKIFIGNDFRFGQYAKGDTNLLKKHFNVEIIEFLKAGDLKISSSEIRRYLETGNIDVIKNLTGKNYYIKGAVVQGEQIGRTIDFPTANIITEFYTPKFGVYYTNTIIDNKVYKSVTNIGNRPTVGGLDVTIETHIIDFSDNIYGKFIKVEFVDYIRDEVKFDSLDELKKQITMDKDFVVNN